jgi:hypothetical protein
MLTPVDLGCQIELSRLHDISFPEKKDWGDENETRPESKAPQRLWVNALDFIPKI